MGQQITMSTFAWTGPCLGSNRGHRLKVKSAPDPTRRLIEPLCKGLAKSNGKKKIVFDWVSPINNLPQRGKIIQERCGAEGQWRTSKQAPKLASNLIMTLFSIKTHHLRGCRAVESHVF